MWSDFIDFGITEGEDLTVSLISKGERILMVEKVEIGKSKAEKPMVTVEFSCPDEPQALTLKHFFMLPEAGLPDNVNKLRKADWAAFCGAFNIPLQFNVVEVNNSKPRGMAIVKHEKYDGRDTAKIEKFLVPRA